ncbi:MAG: hypothetical protein IT297_08990 [Anaerolineae bacterium]|nr:hypothetical protein [Anaerolineae bacterium]
MEPAISIGFLIIQAERGERRAFLPNFIASLERLGAQVVLEEGYGGRLGFSAQDYLKAAPNAAFAPRAEVYQQDYVVVIRYPGDDEIARHQPRGCLVTMLHYPTRPQRVEFLREQGVECISLDSVKDDTGRRLVENLRSVAWNGVQAGFRTLRTVFPAPGFDSPHRRPIQALTLGAGAVGSQVTPAAVRYGDLALWREMVERGVPGVQATSVDYDTTRFEPLMLELLSHTDILVDATQRPDPSEPVIPNRWIAAMQRHAVLVYLSVDPYRCETPPRAVKGIEGIPQGNLDQYVFAPDDPAFDLVPPCVDATHRRYTVSCYSWPGVNPRECMEAYGHQLHPLLRTLIEKGGLPNLNPRGKFFERAIARALLARWVENHKTAPGES